MTDSIKLMEVYIQSTSPTTILAWLNNKFGPLIPASKEKEVKSYLTIDNKFKLTLTQNLIIESDTCTGVMIVGKRYPWKTLALFAKEAWRTFKADIYYACQDGDPNPFRFYKLGKQGIQEIILDLH